ncbi:MAG: hypothetical protein IRY95_06655 [Clostridia bacterium]|nr:hypothetical protein [Clostridia bacterium]
MNVALDETGERLFYEEVREKQAAARGARGRKGKRGSGGRVITPADVTGPAYREPGSVNAFNLYDLLARLQEAPALKQVLLARMEEEYQHYRQAIEKTLDAVVDILKLALDPVYRDVENLRQEVEALRESSRTATNTQGRRRIRWGRSEEDVRRTVYAELARLETLGEPITTETIKAHVPSMLRWIYGDRAIFHGIEDLRRTYQAMRQQEADQTPTAVGQEA